MKIDQKYHGDEQRVWEAMTKFPETFGLRGMPGARFKISEHASFVSEGKVMLYTMVSRNAEDPYIWQLFAKDTEEELRTQIVPLEEKDAKK